MKPKRTPNPHLLNAFTNIDEVYVNEAIRAHNAAIRTRLARRILILTAIAATTALLLLWLIPYLTRPHPSPFTLDAHVLVAAAEPDESVEKHNLPPAYSRFAPNVKQFALRTAPDVLRTDQNRNYSPLSLYLALAMLHEGSAGQTRDELTSALGSLPDASDMAKILEAIQEKPSESTGLTRLANSVWFSPDTATKLNDPYLQTLSQSYFADAFQVDFSLPETGDLIVKWLEEHTSLTEINAPDFDPDTIMALMNTIDYRVEWTDNFPDEAVKYGTFTLTDGQTQTIDFMHAERDGSVIRGDGYMSACLDVKDQSSARFILPDKELGLDGLLADPEKLSEAIFPTETPQDQIANCEITWAIPKTVTRSQTNLTDYLPKWGLQSLGSSSADFTGISNTAPLSVGGAVQEIGLDMNQNGITASGYTLLYIFGKAETTDSAEMILDRPFLLVITKENDLPLFICAVRNPQP